MDLNTPAYLKEIDKIVDDIRTLSIQTLPLHKKLCPKEGCDNDPGYTPKFDAEITSKGIEIHSIRCNIPNCEGIIKQFQDKTIPYTSSQKEYYQITETFTKSPETETPNSAEKETYTGNPYRGMAAEVEQGANLKNNKPRPIPDDKHQREY